MKTYDISLQARVNDLRDGLGSQPLAALRHADPTLWDSATRARLRRILSRRVFPGDLPSIVRMEKAKKKLLKLSRA